MGAFTNPAPPKTGKHAAEAAGHEMGWRQALDAAVYKANNAFCDLILNDSCDAQQAYDKVMEALTSLYSGDPAPQPVAWLIRDPTGELADQVTTRKQEPSENLQILPLYLRSSVEGCP